MFFLITELVEANARVEEETIEIKDWTSN